MLYENKCFNCKNRAKHITQEDEVKAKAFYQKYNASYIFSCGAVYNPEFLNDKTSECMKMQGAEIVAGHGCILDRKPSELLV